MECFWGNFLGGFFLEDFFERIFWEGFFGGIFLVGFLGGILFSIGIDLFVKILSQWRRKEEEGKNLDP